MTQLNMFDASNWQTISTFQSELARSAGAIIKASEGRTGLDSHHDQFAAIVRANPSLGLGHYQFAHPEFNSPAQEVATFFGAAKCRAGESAWLDWEPYASGGGFKVNPSAWAAWIIGFKQEWQRVAGFVPGIYLNHDCANHLMASCSSAQAAEIHTMPWWAADYQPPLVTMHGWSRAAAQQYTATPLDRDWWFGDLANFRSTATAGGAVPQPPVVVRPPAPSPVAGGPHYGFPLPSGYFFGVNDGTKFSVSGAYPRSFNGRMASWWIIAFANQLNLRGWPIQKYLTSGNDGVFGPQYQSLVHAYEVNRAGRAGAVDVGKLGPAVWHDAFFNAVS